MMKKAMFVAVAAVGLAACSGEPEPAADPEGVPGITVENARMVLNAVEGNPAAVYFDLDYDGERGLSIRAADVADAGGAEIHEYTEWDGAMRMVEAQPIAITQGTEVSFEPGGRHVMAMDVSPDLAPGDTTEVTLTVSGGDKFSFPVEVRGAGDTEETE